MIKKIKSILHPPPKHWVGDGFHVHNIISSQKTPYEDLSPFLMMDHAPSKEFAPTDKKRGVGVHPHRGFETVTIALKGEITHRDSGGGGGTISEGGVQWMTAARGVVHDEFHSEKFRNEGGEFSMLQLWVNLPKENKMDPPKYQSFDQSDFASYKLSDQLKMKVIAGEYGDAKGPAQTFSPMLIGLISGIGKTKLSLRPQYNTLIYSIDQEISVNQQSLKALDLALFEKDGETIELELPKKCQALLLHAMPLTDPVVSYGPFVMTTEKEIMEAMSDFQSGKMGNLDF